LINVQINKADLNRVYSALDEISRLVTQSLPMDLTYQAAKEFKGVIRSNVINQKYGSFGKPRKSKWKEGYRRQGLHPDSYWRFLGVTLKSFAYWNTVSTSKKMAYKVGLKYAGFGDGGDEEEDE